MPSSSGMNVPISLVCLGSKPPSTGRMSAFLGDTQNRLVTHDTHDMRLPPCFRLRCCTSSCHQLQDFGLLWQGRVPLLQGEIELDRINPDQWAPVQASKPIKHGGMLTKHSSNLLREAAFFSLTLPCASTPCKLNTFLAKSILMAVIFIMDSPLLLIDQFSNFQYGTFDAVGGRVHFIR